MEAQLSTVFKLSSSYLAMALSQFSFLDLTGQKVGSCVVYFLKRAAAKNSIVSSGRFAAASMWKRQLSIGLNCSFTGAVVVQVPSNL